MANQQEEAAVAVQGVIQPVKEFFLENDIVQVNKHVNESHLQRPFITCINSKNEAMNIWFSKNASAIVKKGDVITKELMNKLNVWHGKNADGEDRIKFCLKGEKGENRTDTADLF